MPNLSAATKGIASLALARANEPSHTVTLRVAKGLGILLAKYRDSSRSLP
jgi:hypothetical protein